ncbi:MAG: M23 family metallopeptidase [Candidatus Aminicenantales bacterium]
MNIRTFQARFMLMTGLICFSVFFANSQSPPQETQKIPYLPLVYEVVFPPSPVKGEGETHLFYELHMTSFLKGALSLSSIEVLGDGKNLIKTYQGDKLSECLVRPGKPLDMKDKSILEGGTRAVLFIMLSFGESAEVPDFLTHRVTVAYSRSSGEKVVMQGQGAQVSILRKAPLMIGPPVRSGVWLAGNCPGDGPVGHRLSMQAWNSRLVVNERYAIDFMKFNNDYRLVHGESSSNSHWYSYGEEVIAVADGVISDIKEGIIENTPLGKYAVPNSLEYAAGNCVILNIAQGVYAVYAHLKPKSLRVKIGDKVQKGQGLGLIGNSGISDAPHLHFHIIDANSVFGGEGLPYVFEQFELLGSYKNIDDNLDKNWIPKGKSSMRYKEIPLGDVVIRFR